MTKEEIGRAAENRYPCRDEIATESDKDILQGFQRIWIRGANFVNERQPYTKEDMKKFIEWCGQRFYYSINRNVWCNWKGSDKKDYDFDQLLKLWEEQK